MQEVLDHQMRRLLTQDDHQQKMRNMVHSDVGTKFYAIFKFGSDGSTGYAIFQYQDAPDQHSLFCSSLVLVQLLAVSSNGTVTIIYDNKMDNSPLAICPLRFKFENESTRNSLTEKKRLEEELSNPKPFKIEDSMEIVYNGFPSMVDGKVKTTWSNFRNSSNNCYVCYAGLKELAQRHCTKFAEVDPYSLTFGFSPLHDWIRLFEWCCKSRTYSQIRSREAHGAAQRALVDEEMYQLKLEFKQRLGLNVFCPRSSGSGTSNTGKNPIFLHFSGFKI